MGRFSTALVVGEIALSCALLVAAGMMVKSVINLQTRDMGFDGTRVFTARLGLFETDYPDDESRRRFFEQLLDGLRAEPEAVAAGLTQNLPALGAGRTRVALEGVEYPEVRDQPLPSFTTITPGYFGALSVPISEGRAFDERDRAGNLPTVIVNESFARRHFGEESPVERRIRAQVGDDSWATIVGVVPDLFVGGGTGGIGSDAVPPDQIFLPMAQMDGVRFVSLAVMTRDQPGAFVANARSVVSRIDPDLPLYWVRTMEESVETSTWAFDIFGSLFTLFGAVALFLAAVGLYGVMAFSVSQRTQEMGVRMAMGAETKQVMGMVVGRGMRQMAIGGAFGLALGALMVRPLAIVFYDVDPSDPTVYAAIVGTLAVSGLLACLIPARRATSVDLVKALRPE